jgi:hypothetical protein
MNVVADGCLSFRWTGAHGNWVRVVEANHPFIIGSEKTQAIIDAMWLLGGSLDSAGFDVDPKPTADFHDLAIKIKQPFEGMVLRRVRHEVITR